MPRVLRIINRFNLGGPTFNVAYLTKYLSPDFKTLLIGGENDETEENSEFILHNLGLRPIIIPELKRPIDLKNDVIAYRKIKEVIKRFKPDIVHTHASKAGAIGRLAASSMKVPVIIHTFHGHVFNSYFSSLTTNIYKTIERRLAEKTTKIIALSEQQKYELTELHKICPPEKVEIIPLGFDLTRFQEDLEIKRYNFRKEYNIDDDEIAIGIIGRLVPIKNHSLFLKSVKYVKEKSKKRIRAFVVGDGENMEVLRNACSEIGLDWVDARQSKQKATLTFTSWIKDVDKVNAGMDIIALTSLNEGTPVSLIEAQAANKPIVSTRVGGIEDIVIPNKTAVLSPNNDVMAFAQNLLKMVENDTFRLDLTNQGWNFVREKFHYTRLVKDTSNLYNSLLYS